MCVCVCVLFDRFAREIDQGFRVELSRVSKPVIVRSRAPLVAVVDEPLCIQTIKNTPSFSFFIHSSIKNEFGSHNVDIRITLHISQGFAWDLQARDT